MRFFMVSAIQKWPNFSKLAMKCPVWQPCTVTRTAIQPDQSGSVLPLCCYGKVLDFMMKKH